MTLQHLYLFAKLTKDARKTYNMWEESQTTGLVKTPKGWRPKAEAQAMKSEQQGRNPDSTPKAEQKSETTGSSFNGTVEKKQFKTGEGVVLSNFDNPYYKSVDILPDEDDVYSKITGKKNFIVLTTSSEGEKEKHEFVYKDLDSLSNRMKDWMGSGIKGYEQFYINSSKNTEQPTQTNSNKPATKETKSAPVKKAAPSKPALTKNTKIKLSQINSEKPKETSKTASVDKKEAPIKELPKSLQGLSANLLEKNSKFGKLIQSWKLSPKTRSIPEQKTISYNYEGYRGYLHGEGAGNKHYERDFKKFYANSPFSYSQAGRFYTYNGDEDINEMLRGFDKGNNNVKKIINILLEATEKAPSLKENTVLYRGEDRYKLTNLLGLKAQSFKEFQDEIKKARGKTFIDPAFCSTSLGMKNAFEGSVKVLIKAPKGTKGLYLEPLSRVEPPEEEWLLPPGTKYKITKVENEKDESVITLEIVKEV